MEGIAGASPKMDWNAPDLVTQWKSFKQHCQFWFAGPLIKASEAQKCNYVMIWIGDKGRDIYSTWDLSEEDSKKLDVLYTNFEKHVKPKSNKIYSRYKFLSRVQKDSDTFEEYLTELKLLVKDCEYKDADDMIRDAIVFGTKDHKVRAKCIDEGSDLTLEKAINFARTQEISKAQLKTMNGEDNSINAVATKQKQTPSQYAHGNYGKFNRGTSEKSKYPCRNCGGVHEPRQCPAYGKLCTKCNKKHHFPSVCLSSTTYKEFKPMKPKPHKLHTLHVDDNTNSESESELFIDTIEEVNSLTMDEWKETILVNNVPVKFQLDTGAKCNVMSLATVKATCSEPKIRRKDVPLKSYSGHLIKPMGITSLTCRHRDQDFQVDFYIVREDVQAILGAKTCQEMKMVQRIYSLTPSALPEDIVNSNMYENLFKGLGCLPGMHTIGVDKTVTPVVHPPRKIPIAIKDKVKTELDRMTEMGVIVKQEEPTEWVNSMVTVIKPNGKIRICIDPRDLNKAICREHYPLKTVEEVISQMPNAKIFTKLDATSGFWQLRLDEKSSKLCTFNTPFGRFRFTRLPFGIKSAPEVFQKVISQMVLDIEGAEAIIDDILVWGSNQEEHDARLKRVLERAMEYNLKLSADKCEFRKSEVTYVGHRLTSKGVKPDPEKIRAVCNMVKPTCLKDLQTFMGFIQYLSKFMPHLSTVSAPLRTLLEKNTAWHWDEEKETSFLKLKDMATNAPILQYYDPSKPLTLSVDASSKGLGAVLIQNQRPVAYASRALTPTQQRYSQIEKETLAIVYGCNKFHEYVYGREVLIETDHKPLQSIFQKSLHKTPPRLQRLLLALEKYDLEVKYKPGKEMFLADHLSRSYLPETKEILVPDINVNEIHLISHLPISQEMYEKFQKETANDEHLQELQDAILDGWPEEKSNVSYNLRPYWTFRDELSVMDGLLYKSSKLIVPRALQNSMLDKIHESHLGIVKCKARAREVLFWIGMSTDVENRVRSCGLCAQHQNINAKEPMLMPEIPDRPWSKLAADLFEHEKHHYLLVVDYFSKWPEVIKLENLSSKTTVNCLKELLSKYGLIDEMITDNGPQFSSADFKDFSSEFEFKHVTSSPHYAQSNGQAERTVQTVKRLIMKSKDLFKALLDYRNTPLDIGLSPAQLFLNRRLKTSLPTSAPLLKPLGLDAKEIAAKLKSRQLNNKIQFDKHAGPGLEPLKAGDAVFLYTEGKWKPGQVIEQHASPRSYVVQSSDGRKLRRNRRHLRATNYRAENAPRNDGMRNRVNPEDLRDSIQLQDRLDHSNEKDANITAEPNKAPVPVQPQTTRSGRTVRPPAKFSDYIE